MPRRPERATQAKDRKTPPHEQSGPDDSTPAAPTETGGRDGPDPTRYGDWEKGGRCIDF